MAAAFSFGSVGDIINDVQITYSLAQALRDTGAVSQECKDLVDYLKAFGQSMDSLKIVCLAVRFGGLGQSRNAASLRGVSAF